MGALPVGTQVTHRVFVSGSQDNIWFVTAVITRHGTDGFGNLLYYSLEPTEDFLSKPEGSTPGRKQQVLTSMLVAHPDTLAPYWDGSSPACPVPWLVPAQPLPEGPPLLRSWSEGLLEGTRMRADVEIESEKRVAQARGQLGHDLGFSGAKQGGLGPEMWGITLDQLDEVRKHKAYKRGMTMHEVVRQIIKPLTMGRGLGYALMVNRDKPLLARVMVSHAWMEEYDQFFIALTTTCVQGPFWVCAMAIYQPEDMPAVLVEKQLGSSPDTGPFATVLKQAAEMVAIMTEQGDIYSRLWCVFEIFIAIQLQVPVTMSAFAESRGWAQSGGSMQTYHNAIMDGSETPVDTRSARCGNPALPPNVDEQSIRKVIETQPGGYALMDRVVEWVRANAMIEVYRSQRAWLGQTTTLQQFTRASLNTAIATVVRRIGAGAQSGSESAE